jgi:hypothetical protein
MGEIVRTDPDESINIRTTIGDSEYPVNPAPETGCYITICQCSRTLTLNKPDFVFVLDVVHAIIKTKIKRCHGLRTFADGCACESDQSDGEAQQI